VALPGPRRIVLVVEDDAGARNFYATSLRMAGYDVTAVEDGVDALQWMDHDLPALIVLDLELIRVSGRDVLYDLRSRENTRHLPVVIVTGSEAPNVNTADVSCLLWKPVSAAQLVDAVTRCLVSVV
jgi:CheY-like chemotaxis protein